MLFSDDEYEVGDETLGKRPHIERPEGARTSGRTIIPRRSDNPPVIRKSIGSKKRPPNPKEPEEIPDDNFGTMHAEKWREFRLRDPYRFVVGMTYGACHVPSYLLAGVPGVPAARSKKTGSARRAGCASSRLAIPPWKARAGR
jgi:hypothetical protein